MIKKLLLTLVTVVTLASPSIADQPNIVYILLDDAGIGDFGCYGQQNFKTPNIDRLATEGMKFNHHYSGSAVCAPSRCSLMTGLHTGHAFVRGNKEHRPVGQVPIPASSNTIAKELKKAGYTTGAFGKWGLGYPGSEGDPLNQGFDEFYGYNCQRNAHTYYPHWLYDNQKKIKLDGKTYAHDLIMDKAHDFIKRNKDQSFFCFIPTLIPHAALHVPEKYHQPWREKLPQFENKIGKYAGPDVQNPVAAYAGMMDKIDEDVGRILDLIDELGLDEKTIVMITSDNGAHREGGNDPEFWDSNGPLRGLKRDLTDGGIRTPMLARWPGTINPGAETDHISAFWDVMPTLCELAGHPAPEDIDGISFVPTLLGHEQPKHKYLYWEFTSKRDKTGKGKQAVRMGPWKGIRYGSTFSLYNVVNDVAETKSVAVEHPEVVKKIEAAMSEAHVESELFPLAR